MIKIFHILVILMILYPGCGSPVKKVNDKNSSDITPPILLNKIPLVYPEQARLDGLEGRVDLYLYIDEEGTVKKTSFKSSSGYQLLDQAAEKYVKQFKFKPARKAGKNISIWLTYKIDYSLINTDRYFNFDVWLKDVSAYLTGEINLTERKSDWVEKEILRLYQDYIEFVADHPDINHNHDLSIILNPQTNESWQRYYDYWPLTFILYDDLLKRFPEIEEAEKILTLMMRQIRQDLDRAASIGGGKAGEPGKLSGFFASLDEFLASDYAGQIPESLRSDLIKYRQK